MDDLEIEERLEAARRRMPRGGLDPHTGALPEPGEPIPSNADEEDGCATRR